MKNKILRAVTVSAVIALLIITYVPLFSVTSFAADCTHDNVRNAYKPNNDGTHEWKKVCMSGCGYTFVVDAGSACSDSDASGFCDFCFYDMGGGSGSEPEPDPDEGSCSHSSCTYYYSPNNDGTHAFQKICDGCNDEVDFGWAVDCIDLNGDDVCDHCKYTLTAQDKCNHDDVTPRYITQKNGTHTVVEFCNDCGGTKPYPSWEYCLDKDSDGVCERCGYKLPQGACVHDWVEGICSKCKAKCPHDYVYCSPSGKYKDPMLVQEPEYYHAEYIKCSVCKYDKVSWHIEAHTWKDGKCESCSYECKHFYEGNICRICSSKKSLYSYDVDYGTWGNSLIFSKDVKYEKTDAGYMFVRADDYIGGVNILNLHDLEYKVHQPNYTEILEICTNSITIRDGAGSPNKIKSCVVEFYLGGSAFVDGETYTITFEIDSPWRSTSLYLRCQDANVSVSVWPKLKDGIRCITFTYDSSCSYSLVFHMNTSYEEGYGYPFTATFSNLQIEPGEDPTAYIPFGALYIPEYDDVYDKAYKDAVAALDGKEGSGSIVKGLIDSVWGITQDCFERLDKATTINGISVGGIVSTVVVFVIVYYVLKLVNK